MTRKDLASLGLFDKKNSKKILNESTFLAVEGFFPVSAFDIILS